MINIVTKLEQQNITIDNETLLINKLVISDQYIVECMKQVAAEDRGRILVNALNIGLGTLNQSSNLNLIRQINEAKEGFSLTLKQQNDELSKAVNMLASIFVDELKKEMNLYLGDKTQKGRVLESFEHLQQTMAERVNRLTDSIADRFDPDSKVGIANKLAEIINKAWLKQANEFKNIISSANPENPLYKFSDSQEKFNNQIQSQFNMLRRDIVKYMSDVASQVRIIEERKNSTHGGFDYQTEVLKEVRNIASCNADVVDDVSVQEGFMKSKEGDQLVKVACSKGEVSFAIETKKTTKNMQRSESVVIEYLENIAKNRGTKVSVLVVSDASKLPEGVTPLKLYEDNKIVTVYNAEDRDTLKVAYRVARLLSELHTQSTKQEEKLDKKDIEDSIKQIKVLLNNLTPGTTALNTIIQQSNNVKEILKKHRQNIIECLEELELKIEKG